MGLDFASVTEAHSQQKFSLIYRRAEQPVEIAPARPTLGYTMICGTQNLRPTWSFGEPSPPSHSQPVAKLGRFAISGDDFHPQSKPVAELGRFAISGDDFHLQSKPVAKLGRRHQLRRHPFAGRVIGRESRRRTRETVNGQGRVRLLLLVHLGFRV